MFRQQLRGGTAQYFTFKQLAHNLLLNIYQLCHTVVLLLLLLLAVMIRNGRESEKFPGIRTTMYVLYYCHQLPTQLLADIG